MFSKDNSGFMYYGTPIDLSAESYPKKYQKFANELKTFLDNITLANEMLDNCSPKIKIDESILELMRSLRELEQNLIKYFLLLRAIQNSIENDKLMEICLGVNDDLNRVHM